jgi:hypothetical protein
LNAFRGLPTLEDLRKTYFWESKRVGAREKEAYVAERRNQRMERLWRVQWHGSIEMLTFVKGGSNNLDHRNAFALLQGHRFLWWRSVTDFDDGADPLGYVSFRGHAGLASPSPLEMRELKVDELPRLICVFGRGAEKQERVTLLTHSISDKNALERSIEDAISKKQE